MNLAEHINPGAELQYGALQEFLLALRTHEGDPDATMAALVRCAGADRAALLVLETHAEVVIRARSVEHAVPKEEWEEISRTVVRQARESGAPVLWDGLEQSGHDGSIAELGILAAAAVLIPDASGAPVGVLYVDVRTLGKSLGPAHIRFLESVASLLGIHLSAMFRMEAVEERVARQRPPVNHHPLPLYDLLAPASMSAAAEGAQFALRSRLNIMILGESGSGKTELAVALASALRDGPLVRATLGGSHDLNTITSELFGHERGAFSGATGRRSGLVEHAHGGTLILDELLNLPLGAQQLLLDLCQFGTYRPLGYDGLEPRHADVRILAVTQGDIESALRDGRLRRDLYFRLAGVVIQVPPLRERRPDLPALAESLLRRNDTTRPWRLSWPLRRALVRGSEPWSGNFRELEACFEQARQRALLRDPDGDVIGLVDTRDLLHATTLPPSVVHAEPALEADRGGVRGAPHGELASPEEAWRALNEERDRLALRERDILAEVLRQEQGVAAKAARRLGIPRTTFTHRLRLLEADAELLPSSPPDAPGA
jgi:transcriptional regulator with GAF, ATPase, and Fis domain